MLDTVILSIPRGAYKLNADMFTPNANILKNAGNFLVKCVSNPRDADKKNGIYSPRLTLIKRPTKRGSEIPLKLEFSLRSPFNLMATDTDNLTMRNTVEAVRTWYESQNTMFIYLN